MLRVTCLKRLTSVALIIAIAIPLSATMARADYSAHDPDDTDTTFDISSVRATVGATGRIRIIVRFFDVLDWNPNSSVQVFIDSRNGPIWDHLLLGDILWNGRARCELMHRGFLGEPPEVGADIGPRKVACSLSRTLLRPTHAIRWKVRSSFFQGGELVFDRAPDGFSHWYPHV